MERKKEGRELSARHKGLGTQYIVENYNPKKTLTKIEHVDFERNR